MKNWLVYLVLVTFCGCAGRSSESTGCNEESKNCTPTQKVETSGTLDISESDALLAGRINIDAKRCNNVSFGMLYSEDSAILVSYGGVFVLCDTQYGERDFSVKVPGLIKKTKYFYRARLFINDIQYTYGDILSFSTTKGPNAFGPFSVSDNRVISFASGNLQYQASTKTWRFAEQQYDYIGKDNANVSNTYSGWIDFFGCGTGNNPTKTTTTDEDYSPFVDWGSNTIGSDTSNTWHTLSKEEWDYIFRLRANASQLYGLGTVNGVEGYILLPDNWNPSNGIKFTPRGKDGLAKNITDIHKEKGTEHWSDNVFSATDWQKMERYNAVFLPAAGMRAWECRVLGDFAGLYWSCTEGDGDNGAYCVSLEGDKCFTKQQIYRSFGYSVRLVREYDEN